MLKLIYSKIDGFEAITIANHQVSLTVIPQLGGKIISLKSVTMQHEWLQQTPYDQLSKAQYGDSFVDGNDIGGWDECFPSISQEIYAHPNYSHVKIPDHGELWCMPWQVSKVAEINGYVAVTLLCTSKQLPYTFERTISLCTESDYFTIEYCVTNHGADDLPFVWSMHPIFAAKEGMTIQLSESIHQFRADSGFKDFFNSSQRHINWPYFGESTDKVVSLADVMPESSQFASKLFSNELLRQIPEDSNQLVEVALFEPERKQMCGFRFNRGEISHFGLWLNYCGWSGSNLAPGYVIGLEPCLGSADSLREAIERDSVAVLLANSCRKWSIECFIKG